MKKVNQLKAGVLLSYINLAIGSIIPMIYTPIILRMLGQAEYGLYSLSHSITGYLTLLNFGLGGTMIRYIAKYRASKEKEKEKEIIGLFFVFYCILAVVVAIVGVVLAENASPFFGGALSADEVSRLRILIYIMTLTTVITFLSSVFSSAILAHERYIFERSVNIIVTIGAPTLHLVVLFMGFGTVGMAMCGIGMTSLCFPIYVWYTAKRLGLRPRFVRVEKSLVWEVLGFSFFVFVGSIVDMLFWATDKVILGALIGTVAVAVYNIGGTFNTIVSQLSQTISGVLTPKITGMVVLKNDKQELSDLFIKVARLQFIVVALAVSGFVAFGRPFLNLWAGEEYEGAYMIALLTLLPLVIPLTQNSALSIVIAQNKHRFRALVYLAIAVLNVISTWLIVPYMGGTGAALCSCVSYLLGQGLVMNIYYHKVTGLDIPRYWREMAKLCIIPALLCTVTLFIGRYIDFYRPAIFLSGVAVYTVIYGVLMYAFAINDYEKTTLLKPIKSLWSKIHKKAEETTL